MTNVAHAVILPGNARMPLVGFGTWRLSGKSGYDAVRYALDVGYRHIDTARMYGNESEVGRALRDSGVPRDEVFVTTKLLPERSGDVRKALAGSLRALRLDAVDLWLVHWPPRGSASPATWREFIAARDAGLARAIGVSNYTIQQIDELSAETGELPAVNQVPWSPFTHDPAHLSASRERGVVVEGYSPLKGSDLGNPVLTAAAERHGVSVSQVVLRWHLEHEIPIIPKSERKERIDANFDLFDFALDPAEVAGIDALSRA